MFQFVINWLWRLKCIQKVKFECLLLLITDFRLLIYKNRNQISCFLFFPLVTWNFFFLSLLFLLKKFHFKELLKILRTKKSSKKTENSLNEKRLLCKMMNMMNPWKLNWKRYLIYFLFIIFSSSSSCIYNVYHVPSTFTSWDFLSLSPNFWFSHFWLPVFLNKILKIHLES